MLHESTEKCGAKRILKVFAIPRDRPRHGLMQHEFVHAFSGDGWSIRDFRAAMQYAYDAGWVELDAQFYCLSEKGHCEMKAACAEPDQFGASPD